MAEWPRAWLQPDSAEEFLTNRYDRTQRGLRITLPRIVGDERCRRMLLKLRAEGVLDWQLLNALFTIVAQSQVETKLGHALSSRADAKHMNDRSLRAEQASDPQFDLEVLTEERVRLQLKISLPAAFQTWELACHRKTPDFDAMKRLLDERYQHSADDIPHDDPLLSFVLK